jgi:hypothetical protein
VPQHHGLIGLHGKAQDGRDAGVDRHALGRQEADLALGAQDPLGNVVDDVVRARIIHIAVLELALFGQAAAHAPILLDQQRFHLRHGRGTGNGLDIGECRAMRRIGMVALHQVVQVGGQGVLDDIPGQGPEPVVIQLMERVSMETRFEQIGILADFSEQPLVFRLRGQQQRHLRRAVVMRVDGIVQAGEKLSQFLAVMRRPFIVLAVGRIGGLAGGFDHAGGHQRMQFHWRRLLLVGVIQGDIVRAHTKDLVTHVVLGDMQQRTQMERISHDGQIAR